jgi:uncharacterized membrane protein
MIRTGWIASLAATAASFGAWLWLASTLPADTGPLPVHWDISGVADRFASRDEALRMFALLPGACVVVALLLALIPSIEPLRENMLRSRRVYLTAWIGVEAMLALLAVGVALVTAQSAGAATPNVDIFVRALIAGSAVLVMFVGDALPKTRPNFFMGVRTPWTLTSDLAWDRTHRLAGRLLVLVGVWGVIAAFVFNGVTLAFALSAPLIGVGLLACVYSYFVWRNDPDRRRPPQEA